MLILKKIIIYALRYIFQTYRFIKKQKKNMSKIFCDIADLKTINKFNKKKISKRIYYNPSLMRKAGAKDYKKYSKY